MTLRDLTSVIPFIPSRFKGSVEQRLSEYVATSPDPRDVLEELLGLPQALKVARDLDLMTPDTANVRGVLDDILDYLGFKVPESPAGGVIDAIETIKAAQRDIRFADEKAAMEATLKMCMRDIEHVFRNAILQWTHVLFGESRDEFLAKITEERARGKPFERLTFGDLTLVLYKLPEDVARSSRSRDVPALFGRPFIYNTGKTQRDMDGVISLRNTVTHNTDGYLDITPIEDMKREFQETLEAARSVLEELIDRNALPLIAYPAEETRDEFGRLSATLRMEDGSERRIYLTSPVSLGTNYIFFPSGANPTPIDPPMCLLDEALEGYD